MFDLDQLFQKSELIPVIIQHARTKDVLMLGFTNRGGSGADAPDKDCLVLEPEPGQTMEQGGDLRPLPPCGADLYRLPIPTPCSTFACPTALPVTQDETVAFFRRLCYDTHSSAGELTPRFGERIGECL